MSKFKFASALLLGAAYLSFSSAARAAVPGPLNPKHQSVFVQDFTQMKTLAVAPHLIGKGTWIAHTPSYSDWFAFADPSGDGDPFSLKGGYLTIRVQKDGHDPNNWFAGYSGGLLSSMDEKGAGFAQKYGYFEASMQTPGGPNTWPGFWLLDAPTLTDKTLSEGAEIDITESYGNFGTGAGQKPAGDPEQNGLAWHRWGHNGAPGSGDGIFVKGPGITTGFHTYGVDVEPDFITWYFDRKQIWRIPTFASARRPMFVLVNLALGGGTHNNADGSAYDWALTPIPSDLKVKYIAVWSSPNSPNYKGKPAAPTQDAAVAGDSKVALTWTGGGLRYNIYRGSSPGRASAKPIAAGVTEASYLDTKVKNGATYYYQVAAVNSYGESPRSPEVSAQPGASKSAAATYAGDDVKTQGDWRSVYGADGYNIIGDTTHYPAYASVSASTSNIFTWAPSGDKRALEKSDSAKGRIVSELHTDKTVTLDINLTDGKPHKVALYFLDWDRKGEVNDIQIKDAVFGNVLDSRSFASFADGKYGVWTLKGHVQIVVTNAAPVAANSQATLSGLFFGGASAPPP
jgi:hypothetical protein